MDLSVSAVPLRIFPDDTSSYFEQFSIPRNVGWLLPKERLRFKPKALLLLWARKWITPYHLEGWYWCSCPLSTGQSTSRHFFDTSSISTCCLHVWSSKLDFHTLCQTLAAVYCMLNTFFNSTSDVPWSRFKSPVNPHSLWFFIVMYNSPGKQQ